MILADISVWISHFNGGGDGGLGALLVHGEVLVHPWVIGELAQGGLAPNSVAGQLLGELPRAIVAGHGEVMRAIESPLARRGIGCWWAFGEHVMVRSAG